jgi:hypothetical protein
VHAAVRHAIGSVLTEGILARSALKLQHSPLSLAANRGEC